MWAHICIFGEKMKCDSGQGAYGDEKMYFG